MILYFADRYLSVIGHASTELPQGLTVIKDKLIEDVETGVSTFECTIPFDDEERAKAEECAAVGNFLLRSHKGENTFFTVIECEIDTKKQQIYIYAEDAGMDLLNEIFGEYAADKEYPIAHYIDKFASGAGFTIGVNEVQDKTLKLAWDSEQTGTARIASLADAFGCDISYSFEVDGLTVSKRYINIHQHRGADDGVQLRLNKEIDSIITSKSIADLATALECTGGTPDNSDSPVTLLGYAYDDGDLYVDGTALKSRSALSKWDRFLWKDDTGELSGGHITRPFSCEAMTQADLLHAATAELKRLSDIAVNYEAELYELPDNVRIGDRVNIVDDAGKLYLSTRILVLKRSVAQQTVQATLGEYLLKDDGISQTVAQIAAAFAKQAQAYKRELAEAMESVDSTIKDREAEIDRRNTEAINNALENYAKLSDLTELQGVTENLVATSTEELRLQVEAAKKAAEDANNETQAQVEKLHNVLTFDDDGLKISGVDVNGNATPNKVVIDDDEIRIEVRDKAVQHFKSDGTGLIPKLEASNAFTLLGLVFTKDGDNNINAY